ncbi:MAG TPA: hypothetical protein VM554_04325 [Acidisarcina sp.]|nr:hypothetical protein [Acidisarcina sp.]
MPLLEKAGRWEKAKKYSDVADRVSSLFPVCANPSCSTSWLHLWRRRQVPVFAGGWSCSEECTRQRITVAVRHEMDGQQAAPVEHRHRVPLGLLMLAEGWITQAQLKAALQAQKAAGHGRLGSWLIRDAHIEERLVTRALSLQWNCPVFSVEELPDQEMGAVVPRLLVEAFGILPIRVRAGRLLHVGFEDRIDRCVTFAIERITGLRVEAGLVSTSEFLRGHSRLLAEGPFPKATLIEAVDANAMVHALTRLVERSKPFEARLVRMHDCYWMRMWHGARGAALPVRREEIEDVVCSIGSTH